MASSAMTRATVRIVPSLGFMTALYALSEPAFNACANCTGVIFSTPFKDVAKPRSS